MHVLPQNYMHAFVKTTSMNTLALTRRFCSLAITAACCFDRFTSSMYRCSSCWCSAVRCFSICAISEG